MDYAVSNIPVINLKENRKQMSRVENPFNLLSNYNMYAAGVSLHVTQRAVNGCDVSFLISYIAMPQIHTQTLYICH